MEIHNRIMAAITARIFNNHDLILETKIALYQAVVLPTFLYACDTSVSYSRHITILERTQQQAFTSNEEHPMDSSNIQPRNSYLTKRRCI